MKRIESSIDVFSKGHILEDTYYKADFPTDNVYKEIFNAAKKGQITTYRLRYGEDGKSDTRILFSKKDVMTFLGSGKKSGEKVKDKKNDVQEKSSNIEFKELPSQPPIDPLDEEKMYFDYCVRNETESLKFIIMKLVDKIHNIERYLKGEIK